MSAPLDERQRRLIAEEAARLLLDEGLGDYRAAKLKAAQRLGLSGRRGLPRNIEVEDALRSRQRLFTGEAQRARLASLRRAALEAMRLLAEFRPRLVGSVLRGTAHAHSDVNLHLFSDSVEEVVFRLLDAGVPFRQGERSLRCNGGCRGYPALRYVMDDVEIELVIFPYDGLRQAPISPVDGRPMQRMGRRELERLLAESAGQRTSDL